MKYALGFALTAAVTVVAVGWLAWQYVAAASRLRRAFECQDWETY